MATLHTILIAACAVAVLITTASVPALAGKHHRFGGVDGWSGRNEWAEQRWREHEFREWAWRRQPHWGYWPYHYQPYGYGFGYRYWQPYYAWPYWYDDP